MCVVPSLPTPAPSSTLRPAACTVTEAITRLQRARWVDACMRVLVFELHEIQRQVGNLTVLLRAGYQPAVARLRVRRLIKTCILFVNIGACSGAGARARVVSLEAGIRIYFLQ
ncbi:hypothetical protein EVAR_43586_1 [Eumeta japonica]|uniref:Uncharacterized protein n=1 Tax=Eumeta variegata TaxID=151549 RepID=A0A4C1XH87_EUMVA|nr:hypothetical protein EVAR_43586_1 [Eumeta japonica]